MGTLIDLANRMKALPAILASEGSRCAVGVAMATGRNLAYVTPVDTSNAISNWQISLENPNVSMRLPFFLGHKGSTYGPSAKATVVDMNNVLKNKIVGQSIFLVNTAPYIRELNNGSSQQQPAGFVERAVIVGRVEVKKFKMKLG